MSTSTPRIINAEIIDAALVHRLLLDQHPDLAHLPLTPAAQGWDNAVFRLGHEYAVRLPRRPETASLLDNELRWLPELAPRLPLPVPLPVRTGHPTDLFPCAWSIVPWFEGRAALPGEPVLLPEVCTSLGQFLRALHQPAPADAPHNPWRSIPLDARTERLHQHLNQLGRMLPRERILGLWDRLVATRRWSRPPMWIHGDLHPGNLLIADRELAAVLDFGDVAAGDPATDLSVMWMLLPETRRQDLFSAAGYDRATEDGENMWRRARGWALALGVAYVAMGQEGDALAELGKQTIDAALEGS
jgi:aminoglycoside phosphotransferase (APT) family kinase protein